MGDRLLKLAIRNYIELCRKAPVAYSVVHESRAMKQKIINLIINIYGYRKTKTSVTD